jgi:hypothetical protein
VFEVFVEYLTNVFFEDGFIVFIDLQLLLLETIFSLLNIAHEEDAEVHGGDGADCGGRTGPRVSHIDRGGRRFLVFQVFQQHVDVILVLCLFIICFNLKKFVLQSH